MATRLIALYDDIDTAHEVVGALMDAGFAPESIDMVARDVTGQYGERYEKYRAGEDVSGAEGAGFGAIVGGLIGLGVALIPGVGLVAAAGTVGAAIAGGAVGAAAGAATGGLTAALVDMGVDEDEVEYYAESLRRGSALVSVVTTDANMDQAREVMESYDPDDIERRAEYYEATGWQGYNPEAEPLNPREVQQDRERYSSYLAEQNRATDTSDAGTFEVVEEDLQVGKREVEEVGVHKDVDYHDETVRDTVRRTEVEVEGAESTDRRADYDPFENYNAAYQRHFQNQFANRGFTYEQFQPAYRYGYNLATSPYYGTQSWDVVETEARQRWEEHNKGTWEQFKDAVREGWNSVKGAVS